MNGRFLYVYVLRSLKDGEFYTGFSSDLKARLATHEAGQVPSTKVKGSVLAIDN
jgi:putative endonuclease